MQNSIKLLLKNKNTYIYVFLCYLEITRVSNVLQGYYILIVLTNPKAILGLEIQSAILLGRLSLCQVFIL